MKSIGVVAKYLLGVGLILVFSFFCSVNQVAAVSLNQGDILITDSGVPALIQVDPLTGAQTIVTSGGYLNTPHRSVIASNGDIYVTEKGCNNPWECAQAVPPAVIKVNPMTGAQTIVSQGGLFCEPWGIAIAANGDLLVGDECAFIEQTFPAVGGVIRVDPVSGSQTAVSSGGMFQNPRGIALEANDNILVSNVEGWPSGILFRVDPVTGAQTLVSTGATYQSLWDITVATNGDIFMVTDDKTGSTVGMSRVIRVNPATGAQTTVSSGGFTEDVVGITIAANGDILIADMNCCGGVGFAPGGVIRIDPATGVQAVVSSGGNFVDPFGITIVPAPSVSTVAIDIKPGNFPNSINPKSHGKLLVAILTSVSFDATNVDPNTIFFGLTGTEAAPVHSTLEDVDGDGNTDIILQFNTQDTAIECGDASASLTGKTFSGQMIKGSDSVKTVGCK